MTHEVRMKDDTQSVYTPDLRVVPLGVDVLCGVCGAVADEFRNAYGSRGFAPALAGYKEYYDFFGCPHREADWHKRVVALRQEANKTPSQYLKAIFIKEAIEVLEENMT